MRAYRSTSELPHSFEVSAFVVCYLIVRKDDGEWQVMDFDIIFILIFNMLVCVYNVYMPVPVHLPQDLALSAPVNLIRFTHKRKRTRETNQLSWASIDFNF